MELVIFGIRWKSCWQWRSSSSERVHKFSLTRRHISPPFAYCGVCVYIHMPRSILLTEHINVVCVAISSSVFGIHTLGVGDLQLLTTLCVCVCVVIFTPLYPSSSPSSIVISDISATLLGFVVARPRDLHTFLVGYVRARTGWKMCTTSPIDWTDLHVGQLIRHLNI